MVDSKVNLADTREANEAVAESRTGQRTSIKSMGEIAGYAPREMAYLLEQGAPVVARDENEQPTHVDSGKFITWLMRWAREHARDDLFGDARTGRLVTLKTLVAITGYAKTGIEHLIKSGAPVHLKGRPGVATKVYTGQIIAWLIRREVTEAIAERQADKDDFKNRKLAAQARTAELELDERRGKLVEIENVIEIIDAMHSDFRARLLGMPSKLAAQVAVNSSPRAIQTMLETAIGECLEEISRVDPADLVTEDVREAIGASSKNDGQPVGR